MTWPEALLGRLRTIKIVADVLHNENRFRNYLILYGHRYSKRLEFHPLNSWSNFVIVYLEMNCLMNSSSSPQAALFSNASHFFEDPGNFK